MSTLETSPAVCCWCGNHLKRSGEGPWWCFTQACMTRQREWSIWVQTNKKGDGIYRYVPTPKQTEYHETRRKPGDAPGRINRMYGGAAGPGKSHAMRWDQYRKALSIPNFSGAILRRTMPELKKTHLKAFAREADIVGAEFLKSESLLKFANGSIIECGHCEDDDAVSKWLSSEYDQISIDEGSTFEPDWLLEISTRARTTNPGVLAAGGAWFDVGTNPGGRCWAVLRDLFVTNTPDFDLYPQLKTRYNPRQWVYVKALLDDNPYLPPEYVDDLAILSDARYRQLRYGEEFVTDGAFFSQWRETKDGEPWHVQFVELVPETEYFASMDWGWNSPGVVLWWAMQPDGHFHIKREWKFNAKTADEIATGILAMNKDLGIAKLRYIACDPSMANKTGAGSGESIFETLLRRGLPMRKSDNNPDLGWARVQQLLREDPRAGAGPWLTIDPKCVYGRRTMPAQVHEKDNPDRLDTNKDDHWADALRYGAMSRPMFVATKNTWTEPEYEPNTWGWWRQWHARKNQPSGVLS